MTKSKITYDANLMKAMSLFEAMTGTQVKDCFNSKEAIYFVVDAENMGRAIGRKGQNVKRLENMLKRKVRILEYSPDLPTFIKNLIYPIAAKQIDIKEDNVTITGQDTKTKAMLIGRNSSNLNSYKEIIRRYFDIKELKVV